MRKFGNTRETRQRKVVYQTVIQSKKHPTADTIFEMVRESLPTISLGTVYRNLSVLKDQGLVTELRGADRRAHFEADLTPHAHFTCTRCGTISDIEISLAPEWENDPGLAKHTIEEHSLDFRGVCPECNGAISS